MMVRARLFGVFLTVLAGVALSGCDSPSLAFAGQPATRVEIDGSVFSVRIRGNRAEALRISREWRPSESAILARGSEAIRRASGCGIRAVTGDRAILRARLACA